MRQFDIIGAGMGTREILTGEAAQALASAEMVFATERLAEILRNGRLRAERTELHCWFREMLDFSAPPENCGKSCSSMAKCGCSAVCQVCSICVQKSESAMKMRAFAAFTAEKETCSARSATMRKRSR